MLNGLQEKMMFLMIEGKWMWRTLEIIFSWWSPSAGDFSSLSIHSLESVSLPFRFSICRFEWTFPFLFSPPFLLIFHQEQQEHPPSHVHLSLSTPAGDPAVFDSVCDLQSGLYKAKNLSEYKFIQIPCDDSNTHQLLSFSLPLSSMFSWEKKTCLCDSTLIQSMCLSHLDACEDDVGAIAFHPYKPSLNPYKVYREMIEGWSSTHSDGEKRFLSWLECKTEDPFLFPFSILSFLFRGELGCTRRIKSQKDDDDQERNRPAPLVPNSLDTSRKRGGGGWCINFYDVNSYPNIRAARLICLLLLSTFLLLLMVFSFT